MDFEKLSKEERYDALTEMADMYYNQGKTQSEIAAHFETNRFKVAKLIQDARNEQIVEIRINFANERNKEIEQELAKTFLLQKAIVVNTQYAPYIDGLRQISQVGAGYLKTLLVPHTVLGLAWGKTIQTVVGQLPHVTHNPISAVQLAGFLQMSNPAAESRTMVRTVADCYFGTAHYFNTPLYINNPELRTKLAAEPDIHDTLNKARELSVVLTGIGGTSSLPTRNPVLRPYQTQKDLDADSNCICSIFGYVFDRTGQLADIDLNRKVMAVPLSDILKAPHRVAVVYGRHKTTAAALAFRQGYINEVITDMDTAVTLLNQV